MLMRLTFDAVDSAHSDSCFNASFGAGKVERGGDMAGTGSTGECKRTSE